MFLLFVTNNLQLHRLTLLNDKLNSENNQLKQQVEEMKTQQQIQPVIASLPVCVFTTLP